MENDHSWQKSSFSAGDDGNHCVELASEAQLHITLRESDAPAAALVAERALVAGLIRHLKAAR